MRVFFDGNRILTKLKISSTVTEWTKEYPTALIDTGASKTIIPIEDILPPNTQPQVKNLEFSGTTKMKRIGSEMMVSVFHANFLVGGEDQFNNAYVVGAPISFVVIGQEIISQYKWEIDYKSGTVIAMKHH